MHGMLSRVPPKDLLDPFRQSDPLTRRRRREVTQIKCGQTLLRRRIELLEFGKETPLVCLEPGPGVPREQADDLSVESTQLAPPRSTRRMHVHVRSLPLVADVMEPSGLPEKDVFWVHQGRLASHTLCVRQAASLLAESNPHDRLRRKLHSPIELASGAPFDSRQARATPQRLLDLPPLQLCRGSTHRQTRSDQAATGHPPPDVVAPADLDDATRLPDPTRQRL